MTILIPVFKKCPLVNAFIFSVSQKRESKVIVGFFGEEKSCAWNKACQASELQPKSRSCRDLFRESLPQTGFQMRCEWQGASKCPLPCCKVHRTRWLYSGCKSYTKPLITTRVEQLGMEGFCYFKFLLKMVLEEPLIRVQLSVKLWAETSETGPSLLTCLVPRLRYIPCM